MNNQLSSFSQLMLPKLEEELRLSFKVDDGNPTPFYGMMQYHMGWLDADFQPVTVHAGKRIRPLLTMLTCAASAGDWTKVVPAAAAVEIVHNFSLVHDDIEDASSTRRGRETLWKIWGEAQAINSGDAMFALAHMTLTRLIDNDIPPTTVVRALTCFDQTCLMLTRGQYKDMEFETRETVQVDEYIEMITGKTAVLLSLCAEIGAIVAANDEQSIAHFAEFGLNLGLAFQVIDDILGIWGDESKTGKSVATDIVTKKKTLPVLYGLERSTELRDMYKYEEADDVFVREVVTLLDDLGARQYASDRAAAYSTEARQHLRDAKAEGEAGEALLQLADMLLQRDY